MKRSEVWWVEFDPAAGSEIRKTLPAVIVSNDAANRKQARVVVVPLTGNASRQYSGGGAGGRWRTARQRMEITLSTSGGSVRHEIGAHSVVGVISRRRGK
jgi:hypothetical protein